jgi:hypothetical protein
MDNHALQFYFAKFCRTSKYFPAYQLNREAIFLEFQAACLRSLKFIHVVNPLSACKILHPPPNWRLGPNGTVSAIDMRYAHTAYCYVFNFPDPVRSSFRFSSPRCH